MIDRAAISATLAELRAPRKPLPLAGPRLAFSRTQAEINQATLVIVRDALIGWRDRCERLQGQLARVTAERDRLRVTVELMREIAQWRGDAD